MRPIAHIYNDFSEKFGIPRQPGLVPGLEGKIVFEKEYRVPEAFRGIEDYTHLWLLWDFSQSHREDFSPTVRPPHLGGNKRLGVFATRSPNRPNNIGLSVVRLLRLDLEDRDGPVLYVGGADLLSGTPIYDVKPYLPYVDSIPEAKGGFTENDRFQPLDVVFPEELEKKVPEGKREALRGVLSQDPRPHYQDDSRVYGMSFAGLEIRFNVESGRLTVLSVEKS